MMTMMIRPHQLCRQILLKDKRKQRTFIVWDILQALGIWTGDPI